MKQIFGSETYKTLGLKNAFATIIILTATFMLGGFFVAGNARAATLTVSTDPTSQSYYSSLVAGADRLLVLQNNNGSWDWDVTGASGPTATTYYNIAGVTAEGLLNAYSLTGDSRYLDGAKKAGDYIVGTAISVTQRQNAYNIVFLQHLGTVTGNSSYTNKANELLSSIFTQENYWTNNNGSFCTTSGCTPSQLLNAYINYRGTAYRGLISWDMEPFVRALVNSGDTTNAQAIEQLLIADAANYTSLVPADNQGAALGTAGALRAAVDVADSSGTSSMLSNLQGMQNSDNSYGTLLEGRNQTTAYALLALKALGSAGAGDATTAAAYLNGAFGYTQASVTYNGWQDTDGSEYAEADSEVIQALSSYITVQGTYFSVKDAVRLASAGDTINLPAGTFVESGQILIDKNLTLAGSASSKPTISVATDFAGTNVANAWFLVEPGITFNLSNVVLDGGTHFVWQGIRSHGTLVVNNVDFRNFQGSLSGGPYRGVAVESFGGTVPDGAGSDSHGSGGLSSVLTVTNSTFEQAGRIGILVKGTDSSATITGNNFTGKGDGDFLDYGVEVGAGGFATISNNTIAGNRGVAGDGSTSAGILVTDFYGTGTRAIINNNTISNSTDGIAVGYDSSDQSDVVAHNNKFVNDVNGINSTGPVVDATNNWWNGVSGPHNATSNSDGDGVEVTEHVNFSPWFKDSNLVSLSSDVVVDTDNHVASTTFTSEITLQSEEGADVAVDVVMPAGIVITGNERWTGDISAPTATVATVTVPSYAISDVSAIAIGSSDFDLTFDQAIKLTFAGQTGKRIGWYDHEGNFTEITTHCATNTQVGENSDLGEGASCRYDDGTDLIVWTKHFSTFVTYTQTSMGGGGGGGGGGGAPATPATPAVPATPGTPATPAVPATPPTPQVLGATAHGNGALVSSNGTVYLISNGQRRAFRSAQEFFSYGYKFNQVVPAADGDLQLAEGPIMTILDGTLVLDSSDGRTIYFIGAGGVKRGFASASVFKALGYKFSQAVKFNVSGYQTGAPIVSTSDAHPDGALVFDGKTVWWVNYGQRHGFPTLAVFNSYGLKFANMVTANAADKALAEGQVVVDLPRALANGSFFAGSEVALH